MIGAAGLAKQLRKRYKVGASAELFDSIPRIPNSNFPKSNLDALKVSFTTHFSP